MEGEKSTSRKNDDEAKVIKSTNILVVDDDAICLSIVAAKLKKFHYQVTAVKHPGDALLVLKVKAAEFDLVVTDVHMPDMNGIQLQQAITREFNLPVVLMSVDGKEDIVLRGLESGAEFFLRKPITSENIMDLWQHSCKKKLKKIVIEKIDDSILRSTAVFNTNSSNRDIFASPVGRELSFGNIPKRICSSSTIDRSRGSAGEIGKNGSNKKKKVVWTLSLHNRFLEAIRTIGFDRAAPKEILQTMNVPGLTRENVASHLQKYRIFLKRVYGAVNIGKEVKSPDDNKSLGMNSAPKSTPSSSVSKPGPPIMPYDNFTSVHNQDEPQQDQGSTRVLFPNQEIQTSGVNYEVPLFTGGISQVLDFQAPQPGNVIDQRNCVGLDISNVQCFSKSKQSSNGTVNFPQGLELHNNNVKLITPAPNKHDIDLDPLASIDDFFGSTSGWDNHLPSFDQELNEIVDQDEFLESLLDPVMFEDNDKFDEQIWGSNCSLGLEQLM